jgi:hypothetical protein
MASLGEYGPLAIELPSRRGDFLSVALFISTYRRLSGYGGALVCVVNGWGILPRSPA